MYSYSNTKNLSSINFHPYCCVLILYILHIVFHCHYSAILVQIFRCPTKVPEVPTLSHAPEALLTRFLHIHKSHSQNLFFFARYFSCHRRTLSVVPLPAISPNWMLSIFTLFKVAWSGDPLYLCRHLVTNLQSSGILSSFNTKLHTSVIHYVPTSPAAFIISIVTQNGPTDMLDFILIQKSKSRNVVTARWLQ